MAMPSANYDQVFELVRTLQPDELQRLRNLIDTLLEDPGWLGKTEDQLTAQDRVLLGLLKEGLLSTIKPPPTEEDLRRWRERKLLRVEGEPLSETIIRERR